MKRKIFPQPRVRWAGLFLLAAVLSSCHYYSLERKLSPPRADFLSRVRYIITREEEKIFLDLPDSEKDAFIEEFWKRRDPDPDTDENEFKMEYFDRLEMADQLFLTEGKPGWLTDRGRIYILFGPPLDRIINPLGGASSERCSEIWYYGGFPVVFRDTTCTGTYQLVTYDLTALREINLAYMQELNLAQARAQKTYAAEKDFFDFAMKVIKKSVEPDEIAAAVQIRIPYAGVWFKEEGERLRAELDIHLELHDARGRLCWEHGEAFAIAITEAELKAKKRDSFLFEIPLLIRKDADNLRRGENTLYGRLKNLTGDEESSKVAVVVF